MTESGTGTISKQGRGDAAPSPPREIRTKKRSGVSEAYLVLNGSSGTGVSPQTLKAYRWAIDRFLTYAREQAFNLLFPASGDGVRVIRTVEAGGLSPASTRVQLVGVRLFYSAPRWAATTQSAPFADVKPVRDKTDALDKRSPYREGEVVALLEQTDPRMRTLLLLCVHGDFGSLRRSLWTGMT